MSTATVLESSSISVQSELSPDLAAARRALGERMYAARIDDGRTVEQIAALDQALGSSATAEALQALQAERTGLMLRLADAALEDDAPLPGADAEYAQVRWLLRESPDIQRPVARD